VIIALVGALSASLLAIAFLLGRESARAPAPTVGAEVSELRALAPTTEPIEKGTERRWPSWADLDEWEDVETPQAYAVEPVSERIERRPDGTVMLSNRQPPVDEPGMKDGSPANRKASDVSAYFLQMDAIRSESGAGDPNAFGMDLIKAATGGSTAGFDQLIADTERMEQKVREVTPPPSCESYHQANLDALAESQAVLEAMKKAIARRDIRQLTAIAQQARTLQAKAEALQAMREQIDVDARR